MIELVIGVNAPSKAKSAEWQERPVIGSVEKANNRFSVGFAPVQRYTYSLQRAEVLGTGAWTEVASALAPSSDEPLQLTDANIKDTNRFYRIQAISP